MSDIVFLVPGDLQIRLDASSDFLFVPIVEEEEEVVIALPGGQTFLTSLGSVDVFIADDLENQHLILLCRASEKEKSNKCRICRVIILWCKIEGAKKSGC